MSTIRCLLALALAGLLLVLMTQSTPARFIRPVLETVPVERIVSNLEKQAAAKPKDATLRLNLARTHAMAYAKKTDTAVIWKDKIGSGPWFGYTPKFVPFELAKVADPKANAEAKKHLKKAIEAYQQTLKIDPNNLTAQLGLAWAVEQSGDKTKAIKLYRDVIEAGWKKEKDQKFGRMGRNYITAEGAGYLIPLLDKDKDKAEIADLTSRSEKLRKLPTPITPVAIPLQPGLNAADLLDSEAVVSFDADGSGLKKRWSWLTPKAGWLVYDPTGSGQVSSGRQLFGNVTFWLFWEDGYQALAALDDNGDGRLTGQELRGLAIWQDANGNGICDPGEVKSLSALGIVAISCRAEKGETPSGCAAYSRVGVTFRDGSTRPTFDLLLSPR